MKGTNRTRRNILKSAGTLAVGLPLASIAQVTKPSSSAAKSSARVRRRASCELAR
jgi:hypothetical protein